MRFAVNSCLLAVAACMFGPSRAPAQAITVLHFMSGANDGQDPEGGLLQSGSLLYGMSFSGGTGDGAIFQIGVNGAGFGLIHPFAGFPNDGRNPQDSLIQSGSVLYGTTVAGGSSANGGMVFGINTNGTGLAILHGFATGSDGDGPLGTLYQSGNTLYGTTSDGGVGGHGTIFAVNTDGSGYRILHSFMAGATDGESPGQGALVQSGSVLYGTTPGGGPAGLGVLYKINTDGSGFTILHNFAGGAADGRSPGGSLLLSGSTLYGTTYQGGANGGDGTVYKINIDGTGFQLLHSFNGTDGANLTAGLTMEGSTLYGATAGGGADALGSLFQINTDGSDFMSLYSFRGGTGDGSYPNGPPILVGSALDGMTTQGGPNNDGVIYSFPISVPEPSSLPLAAAAGGVAGFIRLRRRAAEPKTSC